MNQHPSSRFAKYGITPQFFGWWFFIAAGVALIYLPGLGNALIFDDERLRDGTILSGYTSLQLKVRMLSYGSFVWVQALFGDNWWIQRLINVLIHMGVLAFLYLLVRLMLDQVEWPDSDEIGKDNTWLPRSKDAAALFGVTLFALNPVAVYAVAYLVQRSILMATLFSTACLYAVARAGASEGRKAYNWLGTALAAYVLALFSKEHAVMLPAVAVAVYFMVRRPEKKQILLALSIAALLLATGILLLVDRYGVIFGQTFDAASKEYLAQLATLQPGIEKQAWPLSILNQSWLFFKYGALWSLPYPGWMSIDLRPPYPLTLFSFPHVAGALAYLAILFASLWLMIRYSDWKRFLGLSFFIPVTLFLTEFATVWIQDPFVLYRSYLWALGIPFLAGMIWVGSNAKTVKWAVVIVGVILAGLSVERMQSLRSEASAWADAAKKIDLAAPANAVGRWRPLVNYGNQLILEGRIQQAANYYAAASRTGETTGIADYHLGQALLKLGQYQPALEALERAESRKAFASLNPGMIPLYKGQALLHAGRLEQAVQVLDDASPLLSDTEYRLIALETRAKAHIKLGRPGDAVADYTKMTELVPGDRKSRIGLAMALNAANQHQAARTILDKLQMEGDSADLRAARVILLVGARQIAEARSELRGALALYPNHPALQQLARQLGP